jgi:hypothetical protein
LNTGCTLCPGGNELLPEPNREIIPFVTCDGITRVVERFEPNECGAYQKVIGAFCGCPDAPTDSVCRICRDGQFVDFPSNPVDLSEDIGLFVPCAFYETISNDPDNTGETPCGLFQGLGFSSCCALPPAPPEAPTDLLPKFALNLSLKVT